MYPNISNIFTVGYGWFAVLRIELHLQAEARIDNVSGS